MIIKEVQTNEELKKCNEFLNEIIKDEKIYNDNINTEKTINNYYENVYNKGNNKLFIAVDNDIVCGYIFIKITNPEENAEIYKESIIDALYVDKEYRNKGIATKLIEKAKEYSKEIGAKKISISVIKDNEIALKLYYKLGFNDFSFILKQNL